MNLTENASAASGQIVELVANNPKTALIVPTVTSAIAPLTEIAQIQNYLSVISMVIGICVSLILLRRQWVNMKTAEIEKRHAEAKLEQYNSNRGLNGTD